MACEGTVTRRGSLPAVAPLGQTSLDVSRIGLGLAALGRPGYINVGHAGDLAGDTAVEALQARAHEVLDAALAAGVRYFDAARSYGRAEEFLGSWLAERGLGPPGVSVGSKWGYTYTADWRVDVDVHEVKDLTIATLRRQEQETRSHLGGAHRALSDPLGHRGQRGPGRSRGARRAGAAAGRGGLVHRAVGHRAAAGRDGAAGAGGRRL